MVVTLRDHLETHDLAAQRRQLAEARVKYIVINHEAGRLFQWRDGDGRLDQYLKTYPVVYDAPELTILRVY